MSFVFATPEYLAAAASDLANIGSSLSSANAAALGPTSGVLAAGADEVSATIASLFGAHAQVYQALSAQAAFFHQQFVELMSGGAAQYALTEATNASPLQTVEQAALGAVGAPGQASAAAVPTGNAVSLAPAMPPG
ncbi:PE family protein, partial [Mycobacterium sp. E2699]|uniref:PE family protein n=1 Tax=Mycobacterium sp. E2699 TaxID=1834137 RepID=UPI000A4DACB1